MQSIAKVMLKVLAVMLISVQVACIKYLGNVSLGAKPLHFDLAADGQLLVPWKRN